MGNRARLTEDVLGAWERLRKGAPHLERSGVKKVCVILGASRSGSSFLFNLLARHPAFVSPEGEESPFYRLAGLGWVDQRGQSDRLPDDTSDAALDRVARHILSDTRLAEDEGWCSRDEYAPHAVSRLLLQWPRLAVEADRLLSAARESLARSGESWPGTDIERFWRAFLGPLATSAGGDPLSWYDHHVVAREGPSPAPPAGVVFEEPPYVVPRPRRAPTPGELASRTLLLKASINCHRVGLLKRLFPTAELKIIHLTRNPAGSVNGLLDGWLSNGFHSHNLESVAELAIGGHSGSWWKFDLAPGWEQVARAPLEDVCAFQWVAANRDLLDAGAQLRGALRMRYEDLLEKGTLREALKAILAFNGAQADDGLVDRIRASTPSVMAIRPPAAGKWKARRERILPLLSRPDVRETASALSYDLSDAEALP